jgi:modulator of FtsH protease
MNTPFSVSADRTQASVLSTNKVVRNTYLLLSMTLLFSALTAGVSMVLNLPHPGLLLTLGGYFGLLFATSKFRDSALGLAFVFALTGFMGYTLGPIINHYLAMANGGQVVMTAMGMSGVIFLSLSGYALTSRKDFSFMGSFLMVGILVAFLAGLGAVFFEMPGLSLAVSAMFVLLGLKTSTTVMARAGGLILILDQLILALFVIELGIRTDYAALQSGSASWSNSVCFPNTAYISAGTRKKSASNASSMALAVMMPKFADDCNSAVRAMAIPAASTILVIKIARPAV